MATLTVPTWGTSVVANGETPVEPKELWFVPDNLSTFTYSAKLDSGTANLTLHNGDETAGRDSSTFSGTAIASAHATSTADCNGADAHDVRLTSSVAGTVTINTDSTGANLTGGNGVPYARVATWDGGATVRRCVSDQSGRVWPRGVYAWNGSAMGGIQH